MYSLRYVSITDTFCVTIIYISRSSSLYGILYIIINVRVCVCDYTYVCVCVL